MKATIAFLLSLAALHADEGTRYEVTGIVRRVDKATRKIFVRHDAIPGYMEPMLMPFACRSSQGLDAIAPGDRIKFELHVGEQEDWIDHIRILKKDESAGASPVPPETSWTQIAIGSRLPPFLFKDAQGRSVDLNTFKGVAFAFTFIFTRCPSPNLCPLLSHKFQTVQSLLKESKCKLLSVSIDPEHDTPETLARYAKGFGADPGIWSFATGSQTEISRLALSLGADFWEEQGVFSHYLRTVVVGADGTVRAIFADNAWTAEALANAILAAQHPAPLP
jgi:protein SCO1